MHIYNNRSTLALYSCLLILRKLAGFLVVIAAAFAAGGDGAVDLVHILLAAVLVNVAKRRVSRAGPADVLPVAVVGSLPEAAVEPAVVEPAGPGTAPAFA